jgi:hypothetical protein
MPVQIKSNACILLCNIVEAARLGNLAIIYQTYIFFLLILFMLYLYSTRSKRHHRRHQITSF